MADVSYRDAMAATYGAACVGAEISRMRKYHGDSMSVKELIDELSKLDPAMKVYREDDECGQQSVRELRPGRAECMGVSFGQIVVID